jgi:hypothetical protein
MEIYGRGIVEKTTIRATPYSRTVVDFIALRDETKEARKYLMVGQRK